MARVYLKKSTKTASTGSDDVRATVMGILNDIETGGDAAALDYAAKFDGYDGNLILTAVSYTHLTLPTIYSV